LITQLDQFYGGAFSTLSLAPKPDPFVVGDGVNDNDDASDLHAGSDDLWIMFLVWALPVN